MPRAELWDDSGPKPPIPIDERPVRLDGARVGFVNGVFLLALDPGVSAVLVSQGGLEEAFEGQDSLLCDSERALGDGSRFVLDGRRYRVRLMRPLGSEVIAIRPSAFLKRLDGSPRIEAHWHRPVRESELGELSQLDLAIWPSGHEGRDRSTYERFNRACHGRNPESLRIIAPPTLRFDPFRGIGYTAVVPLSEEGYEGLRRGEMTEGDLTEEHLLPIGSPVRHVIGSAVYVKEMYRRVFPYLGFHALATHTVHQIGGESDVRVLMNPVHRTLQRLLRAWQVPYCGRNRDGQELFELHLGRLEDEAADARTFGQFILRYREAPVRLPMAS